MSDESRRPPGWVEQFPYHWDSDDLVARRELLHFAIYASGALFAGAAAMAVVGAAEKRSSVAPQRILRADALPVRQAHYFRFPTTEDEAMLLHLPGGLFVAFSQKCTHLSCSVVYQPDRERLYCPCHEGVFEPRTGQPIAGPPRRPLAPIAIRREGEWIVAVGMAA